MYRPGLLTTGAADKRLSENLSPLGREESGRAVPRGAHRARSALSASTRERRHSTRCARSAGTFGEKRRSPLGSLLGGFCYEPQPATNAATPRGAVTRKAYSTITRTSDDHLVPWLAAEGPLAYTPESPPVRDSLFQYGWVLPQVCKPGLRRHVYFGATRRDDARDVFAFWQHARRGTVARVAHHDGRFAGGRRAAL